MLGKIIKQIKTKLYWALQGPYNPKTFWTRWGKTFIHEPQQTKIYPQQRWIVAMIKKYRPHNLLEVGCGFGRNIKYIDKYYTGKIAMSGIDISETMLIAARKYIPKFEKRLQRADIVALPFKKSSFDMILSHGVLMHVKPSMIDKAIIEMKRVAKNYIVVIEQNDCIAPLKGKAFRQINHFTYTYNYQNKFNFHQLQIIEFRRSKDLDWFLLQKI